MYCLAAASALIAGCSKPAPAAAAPAQSEATAAPAPPTRATPVPDDATIALAVDRLLAEWREPPEGRSRDDVVADLAALGLPGFERVLQTLDEDGDFAKDDGLQALIERLGPPSLDVMARAIATPGRARKAGLLALGRSGQLHWQFDDRGPAVARALLAALDDEDVETRRPVLAWLGYAGPTGVPVAERVAAFVCSKDDGERGASFDALQSLGPAGASAIPTLLNAIRLADGDARHELAGLLGAIRGGSRADVDATLKLLDDGDPLLRANIADTLGRWHDAADQILPHLVEHLHDADENVASAASSALDDLVAATKNAAPLQRLIPTMAPSDAARVVTFAFRDDTAALAAAAPKLLAVADAGLRTATLRTLNDDSSCAIDTSLVLPLLDDPSAAVRAEAAYLLYRADAAARPRAIAAALSAASDPNRYVRETAARVLADAADSGVLSSALAALLTDSDDFVRQAACLTLARSSTPIAAPPPAALGAVVDYVLCEASPDAARIALRFEGGAAALVRAATAELTSEDAEHVRKSLAVLAATGSAAQSAAPLIEPLMSRSDVGEQARNAYYAITGDVAALGDGFSIDEDGARGLLARGDAGADAIVRWSSRVAPWARDNVCVALDSDETLCRAVVRGAATPGHDQESDRVRAGAAGLAPVLGAQRAVDLLIGLAGDASYVVRRAVASTLGSLGDHGVDLGAAEYALRTLLRDEDDDVRLAAALPARRVSALRPDLEARLGDAAPEVRLQAAAALLADGFDPAARTALFEAMGHVRDASSLADADWKLVESSLAPNELRPADVPVLASTLLYIDDCTCQGPILHLLARLGPAAAPALTGVRAALDGDLSCRWGSHGPPPLREDAIAALAAMGSAARAAIPDLTAVAARYPEFSEKARAAIAAINGTGR